MSEWGEIRFSNRFASCCARCFSVISIRVSFFDFIELFVESNITKNERLFFFIMRYYSLLHPFRGAS